MTDPPADDPSDRTEPRLQPVDTRSRRRAWLAAALAGLAVLAAIAVAVVAPAPRDPGPAPASGPAAVAPGVTSGTSATSGAPSVAGGSAAPTSSPATPAAPAVPLATLAAGRIAYVDESGALAVIDGGGTAVPLDVPGVIFGPPAWSPDGSRVAAIGSAGDATGIYVFDVPPTGASPAPPTIVYRSADHAPFYLSWSPDGARVAFLATEGSEISLRVAMADGGRPEDGPEHDGILRVGAPLYLDWTDAGRMLVHVGFGRDAFAGEIDLAGKATGAGVPGTGDFRVAGVSHDGRLLAYVTGDTTAAEVVVTPRDGRRGEHIAVFGPAALAFDPAGDALAWIAADRAGAPPIGIPMGPLRVLDAGSGDARTLVDDSAVAFFWSPDGQTIAVLRLGAAPGPTAATAGPDAALTSAGAGQPVVAATPEPTEQVHLTFLDAATGAVLSDRPVRLGRDYVSTMLPYFDQYALSHRTWSPDGSSIALPLVDADGRTRVTVVGVDGRDTGPVANGIEASWAP